VTHPVSGIQKFSPWRGYVKRRKNQKKKKKKKKKKPGIKSGAIITNRDARERGVHGHCRRGFDDLVVTYEERRLTREPRNVQREIRGQPATSLGKALGHGHRVLGGKRIGRVFTGEGGVNSANKRDRKK